MKIVDSRKSTDADQVKKLSNQIEKDGILSSLEKAKEFLSKYSIRSPQELSVNIVEGVLGEGTVKEAQIEIQMPNQVEAIRQLQESLEPRFGKISEQQAGELALALATSTTLHEGVHGILDSKPTSRLATDFERVFGVVNNSGKIVTLLDEGLAYAIQGRYAREVQPVSSLAPRINEQDSPEVNKRKALGEKLSPKVAEYMDTGKVIDNEFLAFAYRTIKELETS